ncbi:MAG: Ubiquitin-associated domain:Elongation factor Ts, partial [Pseudomonadota bacterium]
MAEITASIVKELRERTGLGMMECKKALTETDGDLKAAEDLLRIRSGAKASKTAGRIAAEGVVSGFISTDGQRGALAEINCETDFVAKNEDFVEFASQLSQLAAEQQVVDVAVLSELTLSHGGTVEARRQELVMKLGENISVRRIISYETRDRLAMYLHGSRIGVMLDFAGGDDALGK